jgi:hypothetical protein
MKIPVLVPEAAEGSVYSLEQKIADFKHVNRLNLYSALPRPAFFAEDVRKRAELKELETQLEARKEQGEGVNKTPATLIAVVPAGTDKYRSVVIVRNRLRVYDLEDLEIPTDTSTVVSMQTPGLELGSLDEFIAPVEGEDGLEVEYDEIDPGEGLEPEIDREEEEPETLPSFEIKAPE